MAPTRKFTFTGGANLTADLNGSTDRVDASDLSLVAARNAGSSIDLDCGSGNHAIKLTDISSHVSFDAGCSHSVVKVSDVSARSSNTLRMTLGAELSQEIVVQSDLGLSFFSMNGSWQELDYSAFTAGDLGTDQVIVGGLKDSNSFAMTYLTTQAIVQAMAINSIERKDFITFGGSTVHGCLMSDIYMWAGRGQ